MAKCLEIIALLIGFLGSMVLVWNPSPVTFWVAQDGSEFVNWKNSPPPEKVEANKANWRQYMMLYRMGIGLLAAGFLLQLGALIMGR